MAAQIYTTPPGVNASGLSGFSLMHGAVLVPTPFLTAETVAMLDAADRQEVAARHSWPRQRPLAHHAHRRPSIRTRIRS